METKKKRRPSKWQNKSDNITDYDPVVKKLADITSSKINVISDQEATRLFTAISTRSSYMIAKAITRIPFVKDAVLINITSDIGARPEKQRKRSGPLASELIKTDFDGLKTLKWTRVVDEMSCYYPEILRFIVSVMLPPGKRDDPKAIHSLLPKLGLTYGIMLQHRNPELSRIQRCNSMMLSSYICDQKVNLDTNFYNPRHQRV